jgi:hypothetical protein
LYYSWPTPFGLSAHNTFIVKETTLNTYFEPSVFQIQKNFQIKVELAKNVFKTVKSRNQSGLERMFNENKTMTAGEFLVFFNPLELVKYFS